MTVVITSLRRRVYRGRLCQRFAMPCTPFTLNGAFAYSRASETESLCEGPRRDREDVSALTRARVASAC